MEDTHVLDRWLTVLMERHAADLFLVAGFAPALRIDGAISALPEPPLDGDAISEAVLPALHPHAVAAYRAHGYCDTSLRRDGLGRFRVNLHRQRGTFAAAIRALPSAIPTISELLLPPSLAELVKPSSGLVLVCGPTGSGTGPDHRRTTADAAEPLCDRRRGPAVRDGQRGRRSAGDPVQ